MTDRTPPRRVTDREIDDHDQRLYASADGLPASNHAWLDQLMSALKGERAYTRKLERALREIKSAIDARFESYGGGDRPSSPPAALIGLSATISAIVEVAIDEPPATAAPKRESIEGDRAAKSIRAGMRAAINAWEDGTIDEPACMARLNAILRSDTDCDDDALGEVVSRALGVPYER